MELSDKTFTSETLTTVKHRRARTLGKRLFKNKSLTLWGRSVNINQTGEEDGR